MSEYYPKSDLLYAKYRGEQALIPRPETLNELGSIIEQRVKPGLVKLLDRTTVAPVEYGGYALTDFRTPLEMIEMFELFGGQATIDALRATGLGVNTEKQKDDFWVEHLDHFDRMLNPKHVSAWPQEHSNATGLSGLKGTNFLLGPVVRGPIQVFSEVDEFNQNADTDFAPNSSVYVSGELLMQGLYEYQPALREGWGVPPETIAGYFTDTFDMQPLIERQTTYLR